jgi:hypothetical protein
MPQIVCPHCGKAATVPAAYLGKHVRCNGCGTPYEAVPSTGVTPAAPPAGAAGVATVVARPAGDSDAAARRRVVWVAAASVAFLLPLTGAAAFVALHAHGEICGGIEIGSSGVKAVAIDLFDHKDLGYDYHILYRPKSRNPKLADGLKRSGAFEPQALEEAVRAVGEFADTMARDNRVPRERISVVCSSGLFSDLGGRKELVEKNKQALADAVEKATGLQVEFIEVQEEVRLAISSLIPLRYRKESILVDVGGGATRGGYENADGWCEPFRATGVSTFQKAVQKQARGRPFAALAAELAPTEVHESLRREVDRKPGLVSTDRNRVYLVGGAVWVLATCQKPQERDPVIRLYAADFDDFYTRVHRNPLAFPEVHLPDTMPRPVREAVQIELDDQRNIFEPNRVVAGAEVLKAVSAELRLAGREVYFPREAGDVGWLLGFIGEKGIRRK